MLQWGASYLSEKGFDESRLTVELLLSHVLKLKRIQLYTNFDRPLDDGELASFKALFQRRLQHEPLQYILGTTEFMGLEFNVDRRVLIPRPETEAVVEEAIRFINENFGGQAPRLLDIGTGSGCIAISLAHAIRTANVLAIDLSKEILDIATANAGKNGVADEVEFAVRDLFNSEEGDFRGEFYLVVSNPPYISQSDFAHVQPEIRDYEPAIATTDGGDGLKFYRRIARVAASWLVPGGAVIVEHGYNQADAVAEIFSNMGWPELRSFKDYSGIPRGLVARNPEAVQ